MLWKNSDGRILMRTKLSTVVRRFTRSIIFTSILRYGMTLLVREAKARQQGKSSGTRSITKDSVGKDFAILRFPYTHVPEGLLDEGVVAQAKATLTRNQFLMEYGAIFATDSDGFYKRSVLEAATVNKPIILPSGEKVQFRAMKEGDPKKVYVIAIDPAADADNAAVVILELATDHRRIVYCWTTNKKKHDKQKKKFAAMGIHLDDEYYRYIARKIRSLMRSFNTIHIVMDKNGGGTGIAEALRNSELCEQGELPIYQIIDPEELKADDAKDGLHILELFSPNK
jgi:hypothetical protein